MVLAVGIIINYLFSVLKHYYDLYYSLHLELCDENNNIVDPVLVKQQTIFTENMIINFIPSVRWLKYNCNTKHKIIGLCTCTCSVSHTLRITSVA